MKIRPFKFPGGEQFRVVIIAALIGLLPLLPMAGMVLLIPLSRSFPGEVNGYGFPRFLRQVNLESGFIRLRSIFIKIAACALTIGTGGSAGVEGPIAQVGGGLGSVLARSFRVSGKHMKVYIAAGCAGGVAAMFNAPIAGVFFAAEIVLLGTYGISAFSALVVSSVIATIISRAYFGILPAFPIPPYQLVNALVEIPLYSLMGVLWVMLPLILLKILATSITLGSGGAGGVFAPALFIGGVTGGSFGYLAHQLLPNVTASSGAYAAVGIGAFLAATTHAPLTAIFLLFEMTGNYLIIIPIMLASMIATLLAARINHDSIDTVELSREGIDFHEGREAAVMKRIKVGAVMSEEVDFISEKANADHLLKIFSMAKDSFYFPVVDDSGRMTGIVSLQDVKSILHDRELRLSARVGDICARKVRVLTPDDTLYTAMGLFDALGVEELPVVESVSDRWVIGMLKRRDAVVAYNRETVKRGLREQPPAAP